MLFADSLREPGGGPDAAAADHSCGGTGRGDAPRLTGVARLAASGELLKARREVEYLELPTRRYINRCKSNRVPFAWTINPYRGCEFGCKYCYARYTHEFLGLREGRDFETKIFAKQWRAQSFREELHRIDRREWIAIGTATDPYQPAERRYGVTREMLRVLVKEKGRKLSLITKSDLVVRDLELLRAIASANVLRLTVTITTLDERLARVMEPYAPRPALRMNAVRALTRAGLKAGVLACPILPLLNDGEQMLDALASAAARAGAACFAGGVVFLRPCTHQVFFPFLQQEFPHLLRRYRERFGESGFLKGAYPGKIEGRLRAVRARHRLAEHFPDYQPELWPGEPQMELQFEAGAGRAATPPPPPPGRPAIRQHFSAKSTCP